MTNDGARILLVGEDAALAQAFADHLIGAGFAVTTVPPAAASAAAAAADLLVVDGADAALCRRLKDGCGLPLLALAPTSMDGADAVIAKPVRLAVLVARVAELLERRHRPAIGPWRLDTAARLLEDAAGRRVRLTDKEAAILLLLRQAGQTVGRDRLLAEVWGYAAAVTTHTLETHIYRLRRKIEADPSRPGLLVTEPGGYRLADG